MAPTNTKQQRTWIKATKIARNKKRDLGLARLEAWISKGLKTRLHTEAKDQGIQAAQLLARILTGYWGAGACNPDANQKPDVSCKSSSSIPILADPNPPEDKPKPPEKEWLHCDNIDKLRQMAGQTRARFGKLYQAATVLDPSLWPPRGKRGKDAAGRSPSTRVVKGLPSDAKSKVIDDSAARLRSQIDKWEASILNLKEQMAKVK